MSGLPVPTGTPSHLDRIFSRMYSPYSRDPKPVSAITWSVNPLVGSAYLTIAGATASLVMSTVGSENKKEEFNLAVNDLGHIPTLSSFKDWLTASFTSFFGSGFTVSWASGFNPGGADFRSDTFQRPNQSSWGTSSDGKIWQAIYDGVGTNSIVSNHGIITTPLHFNDYDVMVSGPEYANDDREILVRWTFTTTDPVSSGPILNLRYRATSALDVFCEPNLDGTLTLIVYDDAGDRDLQTFSWAGTSSGTTNWTRFRVIGSTYYIRSWLDGTTEPSSWDVTYTSTVVSHGGFVGLSGNDNMGVGSQVSFDQFSVTSFGISTPSIAALVLVEGFTQSDA